MIKDDYTTLLKQVKTASIIDALGRKYDHRAHILDLLSPTPGRLLFGPAVTIAFLPFRSDQHHPERHSFARLFYEAAGNAPAGKVLVMSSSGYTKTSMGGSTKLSRLENHGMAGVLCDGRLRDFDELAEYSFAVYCRGEVTRWGGDAIMPYLANVPVAVDGVAIMPGDYIYADSSGAAVVPKAAVRQVLEEAVRVEEEDANSIDRIRNEDPAEILRRGSEER